MSWGPGSPRSWRQTTPCEKLCTLATFMWTAQCRLPRLLRAWERALAWAALRVYSARLPWRSLRSGMDIEAVATAVGMADTTKALVYVRIAQNYLRAGDDYHADEFIRKANNAGVMECGDPMVEVQFQVCMGFVQDARRNYAQAAVWFHRVSTVQHEGVDASELETLLQQATVSAVLSPPGPSRTRILDVVMRDARTASLPTASMVAKMHKGHFITAADISSFSELLKSEPAKLAPDADGLNDVQKAARLHNLAAVARVYRNISFESLGRLLGVSAEDAEDLAARMIMEDRLAGTIDQESGTLEFAKSADPLHTWDARLTAATGHLSSVSERIASKHPSLAEEAVHRAASTDPTLE